MQTIAELHAALVNDIQEFGAVNTEDSMCHAVIDDNGNIVVQVATGEYGLNITLTPERAIVYLIGG